MKDLHLRVSELTLEEPRRWNTILIQALFSQESVVEIQKIHLTQYHFHNQSDFPRRIHHSSGKFFVKSADAAIILQSNEQNESHPTIDWKKLWSLKMQDCLKLLL